MITFGKKKVACGATNLYTGLVRRRLTVIEKDLAAMAKQFRMASGKNRAQAARELGVARQAVIYAEDRPDKSFFKLRRRIIEKYSPYKLVGPAFWLERK